MLCIDKELCFTWSLKFNHLIMLSLQSPSFYIYISLFFCVMLWVEWSLKFVNFFIGVHRNCTNWQRIYVFLSKQHNLSCFFNNLIKPMWGISNIKMTNQNLNKHFKLLISIKKWCNYCCQKFSFLKYWW